MGKKLPMPYAPGLGGATSTTHEGMEFPAAFNELPLQRVVLRKSYIYVNSVKYSQMIINTYH